MLFTFPSRYWSTIGLSGVFSLAGWSRRIHAGFLVSRATQDTTTLHALRPRFPEGSARGIPCDGVVLQPQPCRNKDGLGFSPVARHYWGNHSYFLFLRVLRCFSSPRWPPTSYWMSSLQDDGLSHSEIRGSKAICAYPQLFAAYHVLHRLREPRHPPCALSYFPSRPTLKTGARLFLTASRYPTPTEGDGRGARLSLSSNMS